MVEDNFAAEIQPDTGCFGGGFGGKEWFEYPVFDIVFDTDPVVIDTDKCSVVGSLLQFYRDNGGETLFCIFRSNA